MKYTLTLFFALFLLEEIFAQGCTVQGASTVDTIVCGQSATLSVFGQGQGVALLSENFNNGSFGPGWSSSPQASWNSPCSPGGVDGTTHIWLGNQSPVPRVLTTASFNLSSCATAGVTICFDLLMAEQGGTSPCEGPDEPDEGIYLQYSTNNGTTWTDIHYFDPNGGNDPLFINWTNWCFPVPAAALTANTRFRLFQDNDSGADYDHWGVDNVTIYCNDPTFNIVWVHDGYNHGPNGGTNPTAVSPQTTTSYPVVMSNGTVTCRDTVTIFVKQPTIQVNAGADTTICAGQCATLNGSTKVVVSPAKLVTYSNNETTSITTGLGQVTNIGINVTGLNMPTVLPNSITQICLENVFFFGQTFFPTPGIVSIANLILSVTCPSGQTITLVPANVTSGGSNPLSGGYTNTCWVPVGGANIATASAPYSGSYAPNQPFNNLAGCTANGVWEFNVQMNSALGFGTGTFSGWSITFDDPEISYTSLFNWSPTTNMTNSTTLNPTVCPPSTATYTLTARDSANCVTNSDAVTVTVQPTCCSFTFAPTAVAPSCGLSNGSVTMNINNGSGNYTYAWSNGSITNTATGLPAGPVSVTITDNGQGCTKDTTIVLNSNSSLTVSLTSTNPTCAGNDGTITGTFAGGTSPFTIVIDTNGTQQTINTPFLPPSQTLGGIGAGTASITITDGQNCVASASVNLSAPSNCCTFTVSAVATQPTCGLSDGQIILTSANGSGNYSYSWASGATIATVTGLGAGSYPVTITDNNFPNCFIDTTFNLSSNSSLTVNLVGTNPTCAGNDGTITGTFSGGTSPFTIVIDTNGTQQTINTPILPPSQTLNGIGVGTASITITDGQGCIATDNVTLSAATNCCALQTSAVVTNGSCGGNNASISVTIDNAGNPPYTYSINGGIPQNSNVFNGLAAGNYTIITFSQSSCNDTIIATVAPSSNNLTLSLAATDITCFGANNGSITANPNGGTSPIVYIWSTGGQNATISNLAPGNYTVTATDGTGCSGSAAALINEPSALSFNLGADTALCEGQSVIINAPAGFVTYSWSNGATTNSINPLVTDTYTLTVTDANGCTAFDAVNVTLVPIPTISLGADITTYEGLTVGLNPIITPTPQGGTFSWSPADFLSCTNCQNTVVNAVDTVTYLFTYTNEIGCSTSSSITVNVLPVGNIFFPNAFSPNGDGNNETYLAYGASVKTFELRIYNRWGEKVFETNNFFEGWNGEYKGAPLPMGVYVYYSSVTLMNNKTNKYKGSLTLIR